MKKYPKHTYNYLCNTVGIPAQELDVMAKNEVFDKLVAFEGYGHGFIIREMVKNIYGIDLNSWEG